MFMHVHGEEWLYAINTYFQSELASKLKKRYSAYSSDDEALPQSPSPPITTADIVMGGSLKVS